MSDIEYGEGSYLYIRNTMVMTNRLLRVILTDLLYSRQWKRYATA